MSLNNKEIQLEDVIQIIKEKLNSGGTVTFTPHGTSMYPMLRNGEDVVVLKKPEGRLNILMLLYTEEVTAILFCTELSVLIKTANIFFAVIISFIKNGELLTKIL